jgi:hypothetical protein
MKNKHKNEQYPVKTTVTITLGELTDVNDTEDSVKCKQWLIESLGKYTIKNFVISTI